MKVVSVIFFVLFTRSVECAVNVSFHKSTLLSRAANEINLQLFAPKFTNVRILSSVSTKLQLKKNDLVYEIVKEIGSKMKVVIEEANIVDKSLSKRGSPLIIILDSSKTSFEKIKQKLAYDNMKFRKFYLLLLIDGIFEDVENILQVFWKFWIHNINVISEDLNGKISMHTFFPFSNQSCGNSSKLNLINEFNTSSMKWKTENFYPEKFENLNLCSLKVAALSRSFPSVIVKNLTNGTKIFKGVEVDIMKEIANDLNLTTIFEAFNEVGAFFENGSSSVGILPAVYRKEVDVSIGTMSLQHERTQILSETKSFLSVPTVIVIPKGDFVSPFEKLFRPFTLIVWLLLLTAVLISFAVILALKTSKRAYNFVIGKAVKNPFMNIFGTFCGLSQNKLPGNNFARFLLMKFLLFCLVFRCLYQGKLFNMLQIEIREKEVETIDEILDRKMVFYTYESMAKRVKGLKFSNRFEPFKDFQSLTL